MKPGRIVAFVVPVAGFAASALVLYPGQYPFDSAWQLWQARTGVFNDTSPVTMTALWSLLLHAGSSPPSLLILNLALFWAGLGLCAASVARSAWLRVAVLAILGLGPLVLVEMAQLLTDAHLAAILTFATGLSVWGLSSRRRIPLLAACAALVYAGCVRHNAPIAILPFGGVAAQALFPSRVACRPASDASGRDGGRPGLRNWVPACGAAVLVAVASIVLGAGLDRLLVRERAVVWPSLALWDLAAVSVASGSMLLPPFTRGPGLTVDELVATGAFDPASNTLLYQRSRSGVRDGLGEPYSARQLRELRRAWIAAIVQHPVAYLRHRWRTTWLLIGRHHGPVQGVAYFAVRVPYRDNPPLPVPVAAQTQRGLYAVAAALAPSWAFAALPYLAAALAALAVGTLRDAAGRMAIAVAASVILYALPLGLLAPGAELRYLTWPIVAGPLALVLALSSRLASRSRAAPVMRLESFHR